MNKPHKSVKLRKGNLFDYLNQRRNEVFSINLGIKEFEFSNKSRNPSFSPENGIPPNDQVTISGPDLPIYYTTNGSEPNTNSDSITSSPTTITLTGLPLTLKARGSVDGLLLSDVISSEYDRNPLFESDIDEDVNILLGIKNIEWVEMRFLNEDGDDENMNISLGIKDIEWQEMGFIDEDGDDENMNIQLGIKGIEWQEIDVVET